MEAHYTGLPAQAPEAVTAAVAAFRDLATSLDLLDQVAATRLGIGRSDLRCLDVLSRRGPLSSGELAGGVGLSASALSTALRRLETVGYIRRDHDDTDRRTVRVSLTETAAAATASLFSDVRAAITELLADLDPATLASITRITGEAADTVRKIAVLNSRPRTARPHQPRS